MCYPAWSSHQKMDRYTVDSCRLWYSQLIITLLEIPTLLCEYRSRNWKSSDAARFFKSCVVQFCWGCENVASVFILWCGLLLLYHLPICLMFYVFRCAVVCSAYLDCNDCLVELLLASYPFKGHSSLSSGINKKLWSSACASAVRLHHV